MKKIFGLVMSIVVFVQISVAQNLDRTGTAAGQFLKLQTSARSAALGGAFIAVENDPNVMSINPAGIAGIADKTLTLSQLSLYLNLNQQSVKFIYPIGEMGVIGFQGNYFGSGSMEITTVAQPEGTGHTFQATSLLAGLTYARTITDRVSLGVSVKFMQELIYHEAARALAFDAGAMVHTGFYGVLLGMSVTNAGQNLRMQGSDLSVSAGKIGARGGSYQLQTKPWPLPTAYNLGASIKLLGPSGQFLKNKRQELFVTALLDDANDTPLRLSAGLEYTWHHIIGLRTGWYGKHSTARFAFGGGFQYPLSSILVRFDYAMTYYETLANTHLFTLTVVFLK